MVGHPVDRCLACDGALRDAIRIVVAGRCVVRCGSCDHELVDGETPRAQERLGSDAADAEDRWSAVDKATRRLLTLRTMGYSHGRLLALGPQTPFSVLAAAGPFDVTTLPEAQDDGFATTLLAAGFEKNSFRAVTLWSGLERETSPVRLLSAVRDLLVPGGVLACAFPFAGDRGNPRAYRVPRVTHFFSRASASVVLGRAGLLLTHLHPVDLHPDLDALTLRHRLVLRAVTAAQGVLARELRHPARWLPDVLWRVASAAELWAVRP